MVQEEIAFMQQQNPQAAAAAAAATAATLNLHQQQQFAGMSYLGGAAATHTAAAPAALPPAATHHQHHQHQPAMAAAANPAAALAWHQQYMAAVAAAAAAQQQTQQAPPPPPPMQENPGGPQAGQGFNMATLLNQKDSRWLQLETCREFQRQKCSRTDGDCKFAHPPENVEVQNGRVTACYDSIKGRCNRDKPPCKYFHPPQHLKDQLLINGRNHLALKNAVLQQYGFGSSAVSAATLAAAAAAAAAASQHQQQQQIIPSVASPYLGTALPQLAFPTSMAYHLPTSAAAPTGSAGSQAVSAAQAGGHGHQMMHHLLHHSAGQQGGATNGTGGTSTSVVHHMKPRSDRIEVCREFLRGSCKRAESECRFAHPPADVACAAAISGDAVNTGFVTLCMDHEKGRCARDPCRYYHRPTSSSATTSNNGNNANGSCSPPVAVTPVCEISNSANNLGAESTAVAAAAAAAAAAATKVSNGVTPNKKRSRDPAADEVLMALPNTVPYKRPATNPAATEAQDTPALATATMMPNPMTASEKIYGPSNGANAAAVAAASAQLQQQQAAAYQQALLQLQQHTQQPQQPYVPVTYIAPSTLAMPRFQ